MKLIDAKRAVPGDDVLSDLAISPGREMCMDNLTRTRCCSPR